MLEMIAIGKCENGDYGFILTLYNKNILIKVPYEVYVDLLITTGKPECSEVLDNFL